MADSNPSSPAHFGFAGNFSAEDIQELLGAMASDHHHHSRTLTSVNTSINGNTSSNYSVGIKRSLENVNEDDCGSDDKAQARSERKRYREKQRRSDVNKQFTDLTQILRQIEAEESEEDPSKARLTFNPTNRVDLIARTIIHLERLRELHKKKKCEVENLQIQLENAKKAGEETAAKLKEVMFNQPTQSKQVSNTLDQFFLVNKISDNCLRL